MARWIVSVMLDIGRSAIPADDEMEVAMKIARTLICTCALLGAPTLTWAAAPTSIEAEPSTSGIPESTPGPNGGRVYQNLTLCVSVEAAAKLEVGYDKSQEMGEDAYKGLAAERVCGEFPSLELTDLLQTMAVQYAVPVHAALVWMSDQWNSAFIVFKASRPK